MKIRPISKSDASAVLKIYSPIVSETIISFEELPPSIAEMERRIDSICGDYPWLVAEGDRSEIIGYCYACQHRSRPAYR